MKIKPNRLLIYLALAWLFLGSLYYLSHKTLAPIASGNTESANPADFLVYREADTTLILSDIRPLDESNAELEAWLDTLRDFENCPPKGIWDVHSLSFGDYCYKKDTFIRYMAIYGQEVMPNAEPGEYLNNLSDPHTQRDLTRLIITNEPNGYRNWFTSVKIRKGLGMPPL